MKGYLHQRQQFISQSFRTVLEIQPLSDFATVDYTCWWEVNKVVLHLQTFRPTWFIPISNSVRTVFFVGLLLYTEHIIFAAVFR